MYYLVEIVWCILLGVIQVDFDMLAVLLQSDGLTNIESFHDIYLWYTSLALENNQSSCISYLYLWWASNLVLHMPSICIWMVKACVSHDITDDYTDICIAWYSLPEILYPVHIVSAHRTIIDVDTIFVVPKMQKCRANQGNIVDKQNLAYNSRGPKWLQIRKMVS